MTLARVLLPALGLLLVGCGPELRVGGPMSWAAAEGHSTLRAEGTVEWTPLRVGEERGRFRGEDALDVAVVPLHRVPRLVRAGLLAPRSSEGAGGSHAVPFAAACVGVAGAPEAWWEGSPSWSWLLSEERRPRVGAGDLDPRAALGTVLLSLGADPDSRHRDDLGRAATRLDELQRRSSGAHLELGARGPAETLLVQLAFVVPVDATDPEASWARVSDWVSDVPLENGWVRPADGSPRTWPSPVGERARAGRLWQLTDRGPTTEDVLDRLHPRSARPE